jgi:hypothetical protein
MTRQSDTDSVPSTPHLVDSTQVPGLGRKAGCLWQNRGFSDNRRCFPLPSHLPADIISASHPSHRSLFRKVTCIKDGFFFCAYGFGCQEANP